MPFHCAFRRAPGVNTASFSLRTLNRSIWLHILTPFPDRLTIHFLKPYQLMMILVVTNTLWKKPLNAFYAFLSSMDLELKPMTLTFTALPDRCTIHISRIFQWLIALGMTHPRWTKPPMLLNALNAFYGFFISCSNAVLNRTAGAGLVLCYLKHKTSAAEAGPV